MHEHPPPYTYITHHFDTAHDLSPRILATPTTRPFGMCANLHR